MLNITHTVPLNDPGDRPIYIEGFCNSGDEKPTENIANGSNLIDMDTLDMYFFNAETSVWVKGMSLKG